MRHRTSAQIKKDFLAALEDGFSVTGAAKLAGCGRRTVYEWRESDSGFAAAWDTAWEARGDWYEDRNREQALAGSMAAILNGLKMHKRIVDRQEISGKDGEAIKVDSYESLTSRIDSIAARIRETAGHPGTNGRSNGHGDSET